MNGTNQPAELYLRHDVLDTLKRLISAGEIPVRQAMDRNGFLAQGSKQFVPAKAVVEPVAYFTEESHVQDSCRRRTNISSPRTCTSKASSGRGGGPETLRPLTSYLPLWHAHQTSRVSSRYCTVHAKCVHVADMALYS